MVGPKPKPVRPLSAKDGLEPSQNMKKVKKPKKSPAVNNSVETPKTEIKSTAIPAVKDSAVVELKPTQIEDAVNAFVKLVELNNADHAEKSLFSSEGQKVSLQISGIKLPREAENQVVKIKLPHSPLPVNNDVCLFVKDLEKGLKVDHEDTVRHFTDQLADKGVSQVTQVISLRELKVEYKQFEAKTQLCHRFDKFLADDRIIRFLPQFLGKAFYKRKKIPVQVNLMAKDLKAEFSKCLNTTILPLKNTGSCSTVVFGLTSHSSTQLIENTKAVVDKLVEKYPGGWVNVRSIHLNSGSTSLPLYVSLRSTADVGLVRGGVKPDRRVVVDELSTVVGGTVVVTPSGGVRVKRKADPDWNEDDDTLKDFIKDDKAQSSTKEQKEEETENGEDEQNNVKKVETEKKTKKAKQSKPAVEDESEDEMEDQEMEYMKKVAEEEEQMEKQLEENEQKLVEKLNTEDNTNEDDNADDDAEAENLLSDGDDSDSDEDLVMQNIEDDVEEDKVEDAPLKKKKSKQNLESGKKSQKMLKEKSNKKAKKQQKFVEKKKQKLKGNK